MLFDLSFGQGTNRRACLLEFMSVGQILHGNRILLMLIQVFNSLRTSYSYHVASYEFQDKFKVNKSIPYYGQFIRIWIAHMRIVFSCKHMCMELAMHIWASTDGPVLLIRIFEAQGFHYPQTVWGLHFENVLRLYGVNVLWVPLTYNN